MHYSIRHLTKFRYRSPVSESIMELMMHPRSDGSQRCLNFQVSVSPRCRVFSYRDHLANHVHHFDIPVQHEQLVIVAESLVEVQPLPELPYSLGAGAWEELDRLVEADDFWEMLLPSEFACPTPALEKLANQLDVRRRDDPLRVLHTLNQQMYEYFSYVPNSTRADSPIDVALKNKGGVCQDFAHIMTTLVRTRLRIPCRYVSGYLSQSPDSPDAAQGEAASGEKRTDRSPSSATHAWVEAYLPELGWVGFDPTNWLYANDRHIRTAIGRDYSDVPPTHGIFRGRAKSELTVAVRVTPSEAVPSFDQDMPVPEEWTILVEKAQALPAPAPVPRRQLQQAQQQQ